eukprot:1159427-Pelagomonas_calceolata.AAC.1
MLTRSYNPYNFTTEGFTSKGSNGGQHYKISEKDIWIIRRQGAGASSTVFKGFHFRENRFVAVKKINVLDRETRHQMLNDVKALCDARAVPGLIAFAGAFHMPDSGQIAIVSKELNCPAHLACFECAQSRKPPLKMTDCKSESIGLTLSIPLSGKCALCT